MEQAALEAPRPSRTTVVEPPKGWPVPSWRRDVWDQRDLLYFLARRDAAVRYRQSVIGIFWAMLQAVLIAAVFTVFFGNFADIPSVPGVPYSLFAVTGMLLWIFFTMALQSASESTVSSGSLISKVYFPRMVIPISALAPALLDFLVGFVLIIGLVLAYGFVPGIQILLMPLLILVTLATALGLGLWFSALNVRFRDIYVVLPLVILVGLFVSPILYPIELIEQQAPAAVEPIYALNPMAGILELYRWMLLDVPFPGLGLTITPIVISVLLLVSGAFYFKRAEGGFADVI